MERRSLDHECYLLSPRRCADQLPGLEILQVVVRIVATLMMIAVTKSANATTLSRRSHRLDA